jgi:putative sigma-54 modulation protein
MKVTYTGRQDPFEPAQKKKLEAKLAKLGKLFDSRNSEREAHIILTSERHLRRAEITARVNDHPMAGLGTGADQFASICEAIDHLQTQVLKVRAKKRDTKRDPKPEWEPAGSLATGPAVEEAGGQRVYHVNEHTRRKPMTLEEALIELDEKRDYVVFRDAGTDRVSVLFRRRDGHFDLVEA